VTHGIEHKHDDRIATPRSAKANNIAWVILLCCAIASFTIVLMQYGVISRLLEELDGPATPASVIRIEGKTMLVCILQPGSTPDQPYYKCQAEQ
jgi:hypothetical protein